MAPTKMKQTSLSFKQAKSDRTTRSKKKLEDKEISTSTSLSPTKRTREPLTSLGAQQCSPPKKCKGATAYDFQTPSSSSPVRLLSPGKLNLDLSQTPIKQVSFQLDENSPAKTRVGKSEILNKVALQASKKLFSEETFSPIQQARQALHISEGRLVGREREVAQITEFIKERVEKRNPGSMYISGPPGIGKTASVMAVVSSLSLLNIGAKVININCKSLGSPNEIFTKVSEGLGLKKTVTKSSKTAQSAVEKTLTKSKGKEDMIVLVLDEVDELQTQLLYTIFEWPLLEQSRVVLIGIANTLDLINKVLQPRFRSAWKGEKQPEILNFEPYTTQQITNIILNRLKEASADQLMTETAVKMCAAKVASVGGDVRKALDVCRQTVEKLEKAPVSTSPEELKVGPMQIVKIVEKVLGSKASSASKLTLQQGLLVCCLFHLLKSPKVKEVTLGKLHETLSRVCRKQGISAASNGAPTVSQSDVVDLCRNVDIVQYKQDREPRLSKIKLTRLDEAELEMRLEEKNLLAQVLEDLASQN